jgi:hypothetical protein
MSAIGTIDGFGFGGQLRLAVLALAPGRLPRSWHNELAGLRQGPSPGLQDLESLGKPAVGQPGLRSGPAQPAAQELL